MSNLQIYLNQLEELTWLISIEKGESVEADNLRDDMDYVWNQLTDSEIDQLR